MSWLDIFRSRDGGSARVAKERLQVVIAHERSQRGTPHWLPNLRRELIEVIQRYVEVDDEKVRVQMERDGDYEVLELNITLPERPLRAGGARGAG